MKKKKTLFDYLPKNYAKKISANCGVSEAMVYLVKTGKRNNTTILQKLVDAAKAEKKKVLELEKQINS